MTLDQMGNVGEVVAALATVATLIYLAGQLRQNTRALKATAFQAVISEMGSNVQNLGHRGLLRFPGSCAGVTPEQKGAHDQKPSGLEEFHSCFHFASWNRPAESPASLGDPGGPLRFSTA